MYQNENLHSGIILITSRNLKTYFYNSSNRHQNPQYMKILIYRGCPGKNVIFMQF